MPQTVFLVETTPRDVLIVTPRGDAVGFLEVDVASNAESVLDQIRAVDPPRVVADLSASNYFGSVVIGALASFAEAAADGGGAFVACNVSEEMQAVLKVMRLDDRWTLCQTLREAIRTVRDVVS